MDPARHEGREIVFRGRVQGVGFRRIVTRLVEHEGLTGWIRNEPDGSVRMVAEGTEAAQERALAAIEDRFSGFIDDRTVRPRPASGEFAGFRIVRA